MRGTCAGKLLVDHLLVALHLYADHLLEITREDAHLLEIVDTLDAHLLDALPRETADILDVRPQETADTLDAHLLETADTLDARHHLDVLRHLDVLPLEAHPEIAAAVSYPQDQVHQVPRDQETIRGVFPLVRHHKNLNDSMIYNIS